MIQAISEMSKLIPFNRKPQLKHSSKYTQRNGQDIIYREEETKPTLLSKSLKQSPAKVDQPLSYMLESGQFEKLSHELSNQIDDDIKSLNLILNKFDYKPLELSRLKSCVSCLLQALNFMIKEKKSNSLKISGFRLEIEELKTKLHIIQNESPRRGLNKSQSGSKKQLVTLRTLPSEGYMDQLQKKKAYNIIKSSLSPSLDSTKKTLDSGQRLHRLKTIDRFEERKLTIQSSRVSKQILTIEKADELCFEPFKDPNIESIQTFTNTNKLPRCLKDKREFTLTDLIYSGFPEAYHFEDHDNIAKSSLPQGIKNRSESQPSKPQIYKKKDISKPTRELSVIPQVTQGIQENEHFNNLNNNLFFIKTEDDQIWTRADFRMETEFLGMTSESPKFLMADNKEVLSDYPSCWSKNNLNADSAYSFYKKADLNYEQAAKRHNSSINNLNDLGNDTVIFSVASTEKR